MTLIVIFANYSLKYSVYYFSHLLKKESYSAYNQCFIGHYSFVSFFNSAFLPYIVHGLFDETGEITELLIWDVHFILLSNAFSPITGKLVDYYWFRKILKRRKIIK